MHSQKLICHEDKSAKEQIIKNNHKNVSISNYCNMNIDTLISGPPESTFVCHIPKVNSVRFEDPYDHINPMCNNNYTNHIVNAHY